ncbi:MAG: hypothetical protein NZ556_07790 [Fimbriimonadales bacterium]|nr:hypothetical protein [Fimbriimonadales bacterium]
MGVLIYQRKGNPAKNWYRVDEQKLCEVISEFLDCRIPANKIAGSLQSCLQESRKQDCSVPANKSAETPQTHDSENTSENCIDYDREVPAPSPALQTSTESAKQAQRQLALYTHNDSEKKLSPSLDELRDFQAKTVREFEAVYGFVPPITISSLWMMRKCLDEPHAPISAEYLKMLKRHARVQLPGRKCER